MAIWSFKNKYDDFSFPVFMERGSKKSIKIKSFSITELFIWRKSVIKPFSCALWPVAVHVPIWSTVRICSFALVLVFTLSLTSSFATVGGFNVIELAVVISPSALGISSLFGMFFRLLLLSIAEMSQSCKSFLLVCLRSNFWIYQNMIV